MLAYVTVGSNDLPRASKFYDALLAEKGCKRLFETDRIVLWGTSMAAPMMSVCKPYDGKAASVGNGTMVAFAGGSRADVDRLYNKAIELGATDEGKPGERGPGFYLAYFRDLDGNKIALLATA